VIHECFELANSIYSYRKMNESISQVRKVIHECFDEDQKSISQVRKVIHECFDEDQDPVDPRRPADPKLQAFIKGAMKRDNVSNL